MSDFYATGPDLKKMILVAKKKPLPFAFNPGKSEADDLFAIDRKKKPDLLGKAAKGDGAGNKVAFGTIAVEGKTATLTCERSLPGLAKKLKKWFKSQKLPLNFIILDSDGTLLEDDIEDLGPQDDGDTDTEAPTDDDPRIARLHEVIAAMRAAIDRLPENAPKAKLLAALDIAEKQVDAIEIDTAAATLGKLRDALAKLGARGAPTPSAEQQKWEQAKAKVEAPVLAALSSPSGDTTKLRALWMMANEKPTAVTRLAR